MRDIQVGLLSPLQTTFMCHLSVAHDSRLPDKKPWEENASKRNKL